MAEPQIAHTAQQPRGSGGGSPAVDFGCDAAVIARSVRDPAAFAVLYDRHAAAIFRYAARRLGRQFAEDITAETFLDAFRRRRRYDPSRPDCRPWLYGIASNLIGKQRRDEIRRLGALARLATGGESARELDELDERIWAGAARAQLAAALAMLSRQHREVVLLVAWGELTYEEVAVALGIPVGTVRSRLNRARRILRDALPGLHEDPTIKELTHD